MISGGQITVPITLFWFKNEKKGDGYGKTVSHVSLLYGQYIWAFLQQIYDY
jgi:hypothetical protein